MKIAILTNPSTMDKCTGAGCLKALNSREDAFSEYGEIELLSFTHLGGDLDKKIDKLKSIGVETIHVSTCARANYENYQDLCSRLANDFNCVGYTHGGLISKKGIEAVIKKRNPK